MAQIAVASTAYFSAISASPILTYSARRRGRRPGSGIRSSSRPERFNIGGSLRHTLRMFRRILIVSLLAFSGASLSSQQTFDVIVRNGTVYDGTGGAGRRADVGIRGDRIVAIGDLSSAKAP